MKRQIFWLACGVIFAVAIFFRFYHLGEIPVSLYWDETAMLVDARVVAETGKDMHGNSWFQAIFPSYGDYKLPVYIWLATLVVKIAGASEWAVRFPSAIAGVLTIVIAGLLACEFAVLANLKIDQKKLFLATITVVGTSFWSIMFSRTGFEGHLAQMFVGLSILLLLYSSKAFWLLFFSAAVGALAVYTYYSVRFVWPVVFAMTTLFLCMYEFPNLLSFFKASKKNKVEMGKFVAFHLLALVFFFVLLLPMAKSPYYQASQQFRLSAASILQDDDRMNQVNQYRLLAGNTIIDKVLFRPEYLLLRDLALNYSKHLSFDFLFLHGDVNLRHGTGEFGLFAAILSIPLLVGIYFIFRRNWLFGGVLAAWWLISLLPASVPVDTPHALRSLNALIPISLFISFGSYLLLSWSTLLRKVIAICFVAIFIWEVASFWNFYLHEYPRISSPAWQSGYKELAEKIYAESKKNNVIVSVPDNRLYLWLLAYNFYTPQEIQAFTKEAFEVKTINSITFRNLDIFKLKNTDKEVTAFGAREEFENSIRGEELVPISKEYLGDQFNNNLFLMARFNNQQ